MYNFLSGEIFFVFLFCVANFVVFVRVKGFGNVGVFDVLVYSDDFVIVFYFMKKFCNFIWVEMMLSMFLEFSSK